MSSNIDAAKDAHEPLVPIAVRAEPPSPCVRRCTLDPHDLCVGCGRMLDEILGWVAAPAVRKEEIRAAAALRLEARRQSTGNSRVEP